MRHTPYSDDPSIMRGKWFVTLIIGLPCLAALGLLAAQWAGVDLQQDGVKTHGSPLVALVPIALCGWILQTTWGFARTWDRRAAWVLENVTPVQQYATFNSGDKELHVRLFATLEEENFSDRWVARPARYQPNGEERVPVQVYRDPEARGPIVVVVNGIRIWPFPVSGGVITTVHKA